MVAEFESDLIRLRTREGMKVAKAIGHLRGKQPKLTRRQETHLVSLLASGEYSTAEVAELFGVGRSTVYRAIERQRDHALVVEIASDSRNSTTRDRTSVPHDTPMRGTASGPGPDLARSTERGSSSGRQRCRLMVIEPLA